MHKVKKKAAPKKRRRTRGDYIRLAVFLFVVGGFLFTVMSQQLHLSDIRDRNNQYKKEIARKEKELALLEQKGKENSSADFYERKARDEGYVLENETVYIVGN